jgi:hypothetical protein
MVASPWFGLEPVWDQVTLGRKISQRWDRDHWRAQLELPPENSQLADVSEVFREDRKVLGTWSEGIRKLDVEWAVSVSPRLVSRWLGFLAEREAWPTGEVERRWGVIRQMLRDRQTFVVILSAFPHREMLGLGDTKPAKREEMEDFRLVFQAAGQTFESGVTEIAAMRAETRGELDRMPWWQFSPLAGLVGSPFETRFEPPVLERGEYYRRWYWVRPELELPHMDVTLRIASRRKNRLATFGL